MATLPDVLDQRFSSDEMQGFPGEAGGTPARGEDADDVLLGGWLGHEMKQVAPSYGEPTRVGKDGLEKVSGCAEFPSKSFRFFLFLSRAGAAPLGVAAGGAFAGIVMEAGGDG